MLLLFVHGKVSFTELQRHLGLAPGNPNHHLGKLLREGYVELLRRFWPRRPVTIAAITEEDRNEFRNYIARFKQVLDRIERDESSS